MKTKRGEFVFSSAGQASGTVLLQGRKMLSPVSRVQGNVPALKVSAARKRDVPRHPCQQKGKENKVN